MLGFTAGLSFVKDRLGGWGACDVISRRIDSVRTPNTTIAGALVLVFVVRERVFRARSASTVIGLN